MIKIDTNKIENKYKNRHLFETIIPRKQTKINNVVHFPTNPILDDKIRKNKLKIIKRKKKHILSMGKLIKFVHRVSRASTTNL